jgi:hypothetical protein
MSTSAHHADCHSGPPSSQRSTRWTRRGSVALPGRAEAAIRAADGRGTGGDAISEQSPAFIDAEKACQGRGIPDERDRGHHSLIDQAARQTCWSLLPTGGGPGRSANHGRRHRHGRRGRAGGDMRRQRLIGRFRRGRDPQGRGAGVFALPAATTNRLIPGPPSRADLTNLTPYQLPASWSSGEGRTRSYSAAYRDRPR